MTEVSKFRVGGRVSPTVGWPVLASFGAALLAAGCSADISRFGGPGFSLNGGDDRASLVPPEALSGGGSASLSEQSPRIGYGGGAATANIQTSALPTASGANDTYQPTSRGYEPPTSYQDDGQAGRGQSRARPETRTANREPSLEKGEPITIDSGDTLYGLSRRHGVSVAELMSVNGLDDSMLKVGQTLYLPSGASAGAAASRSIASERSNSRPAPPRDAVAAAETVEAPASWNGRYEMRSGDSLYKVALQYGVKTSELQSYNGITDPRRMRPGTVLRVPGGSSAPSEEPANSVAETAAETREQQPTILNSGERYASLTEGRANDAGPEVRDGAARGVRTVAIAPPSAPVVSSPTVSDVSIAGDGNKLLWPVRGKVIAGFGSRPDGTHNDGVNFAVPAGTDVMAAQDGVVAYAGSELRSYGNLILVRHDNGWVTAYAHNDKLLVARGDKVTRGQVIAKSGSTGQVDQPQVHFELRQSSKKPVDPIPYFEKL